MGDAPLHAGTVFRRAVALVACATLAVPGCAVRSWTPEPEARLAGGAVSLAPGELARLTDATGAVEIEVAGCSFPFVTGRARPGTARVGVELARASSLDVQTGGGLTRRGLSPAGITPADLAGRDVQLAMPEGPVAVRVIELDAQGVLHGQPLACHVGQRTVPCTGLVRVDLRGAKRVEVKRKNASASALASVAGTAAVLAVLYGVWMAYWSNYDK